MKEGIKFGIGVCIGAVVGSFVLTVTKATLDVMCDDRKIEKGDGEES